MMKINYRKESGASYMIIDEIEDSGDPFRTKMLLSLSSPQLLPVKTEYINGKLLFMYDISGKQSFGKSFETGKLTYSLLLSFLEALKAAAHDLNEHLLDEDMIMLNPDTVFLDRSYNDFYFCCNPGAASESSCTMENFFSSLLSVIDYDDKQLVALAFGINRLFQTDNFSLKDVFDEAESHQSPKYPQTPYAGPQSVISGAGTAQSSDPASSSAGSQAAEVKGSFFDKAKIYFKGKSASEIYDAINSGKIIRLIKDTRLPQTVSQSAAYANAYYEPPSYISKNISRVIDENKNENDAEKDPISDTASLNLQELPFHRLTGLENALGIVITLDHFPFTIGSPGSPADHHLDWPTISRLHCRIYEEAAGAFAIEDLNSKNGSSVNETPLAPYEKTPLTPGDNIMLSDMKFIFF